MARKRPLFLDTEDGTVKRLDPSFDVLDAKIEAADVLNLNEAIDDRVAVLLKESTTIQWIYLDASDELRAEVKSASITDDHISPSANIAWSKVSKDGSSLAHLATRYHQDLQNVQGGTATEQYHLSQTEHDTLTTGQDATTLHHHDSRYYTQTQLQTPNQSQVHWDNVTNKPSTFPPSPHQHTSADITDFTEAAQDATGAALTSTDTVELIYQDDLNQILANVRFQSTNSIDLLSDTNGLKADLRLDNTGTIDLQVTTSGLKADLKPSTILDEHISNAANIAWSKIDKTGARLQDLNAEAQDGKGLIYNLATDTYEAATLLTDAHRTATPIDHPDGSVTEPKLANNAVTARTIAPNVDVSGKGFNSDKVDGKDVNDLGSDDTVLWTAAKIISYVDECLTGSTSFQDPVKDKDLCTPPSTPATGDRYIVCASGATDAWSGHENDIAEWDGTAWVFSTPSEGWVTWVEDENTYYIFNGTSWTPWSANIDHNTLLNLQGGSTTERYHLTATQHTQLTAGQSADAQHFHSVLKDASGNTRLRATDTALDAQSNRITAVADPTDPSDAVNLNTLQNWQHNDLQGLQGGAPDGYYHLTEILYQAHASQRTLTFDNLTVRGGRYLKVPYTLFADKNFVRVYQNGTLLDPAQWDFYLGPFRHGKADLLTDTIQLTVPDTTATYRVEYDEWEIDYEPPLELYRLDGQETSLINVQYRIHNGYTGVDYFLETLTFDKDNLAATGTYRGIMLPSNVQGFTYYYPTHVRVRCFAEGATVSPWRLEVYRRRSSTPKRRHRFRADVPRLATNVNRVQLLSLSSPSGKLPEGCFFVRLRHTALNLLSRPSRNLVLKVRTVYTNDGFAQVGYYWLPLLR